MEMIKFDNGIREYAITGGGVLRFNPTDPNLYARFLEAAEKITEVEETLLQEAKTTEQGAEQAVKLLRDADARMKETLNWVFGAPNDFEALLGGVNLLAVAANGERVVTNLFAALQPILVEGAQAMAKDKVNDAVAKAKNRRAAT